MLSNDDGWDYSITGIVANCKENETAIKSTLKELQEFGYLEVIKKNPNSQIATIHYEYIVHEQPVKHQEVGDQEVGFLPLDDQPLEKQGQINTNKRNTKIRNLLSKDSTEFIERVESRSRKPNLFQKCMQMIDDFTDNIELQENLKEFFNRCKENAQEANQPFYSNTFQGKLNKLKQLSTDTKEQNRIVLQTLDEGWNGFYPLKQEAPSKKPISTDVGHTVHRADKDRLRRAIKDGTAEKF